MPSTDPSATTPLTGATSTWTLDPATTTVDLATKAMWGLAKVKARFTTVEGSGTVAADGAMSGRVVVDAASVDTRSTKRDTHLRGADFFEVETYPTFTYELTGASPTSSGAMAATGTLTVHGQTRPLDLVVDIAESGPTRAVVTTEVDIDRSQWGVSWSKMGAKLDNHVVVKAVFTKS